MTRDIIAEMCIFENCKVTSLPSALRLVYLAIKGKFKEYRCKLQAADRYRGSSCVRVISLGNLAAKGCEGLREMTYQTSVRGSSAVPQYPRGTIASREIEIARRPAWPRYRPVRFTAARKMQTVFGAPADGGPLRCLAWRRTPFLKSSPSFAH